ncbi:hypothetical protein ABZ234_31910 [Nocardiopsis sp. NPDC006198]|uniref:hypothetical protein n=1 Tax=Nocardiopsis sp. NPDC006198 TaxID=3154472 RepID=UPI0033A3C3FB
MSTPDEQGRDAAAWLYLLVRSHTLTAKQVDARMGHTDLDLGLLLARYATGPEAVLCRARQRAVLGIGEHESAPPALAVRLAEELRDHVSGTELPADVVQALEQVRAHWASVAVSD